MGAHGLGSKSITSTPTKLDTEQLTPTKKARLEDQILD
jgi:hypothetical protein